LDSWETEDCSAAWVVKVAVAANSPSTAYRKKVFENMRSSSDAFMVNQIVLVGVDDSAWLD
jgi:hypothetical protein